MKMSHHITHQASNEKGVALIMSLIVLILITLIGLSSIRNTGLQERMSANLYDRQLTFQASESALLAAEVAIANNPDITVLGGVDCSSTSANTCPMVPANTWTNDATNWTTIPNDYRMNDGILPSTAQYHVAFVGQTAAASSSELGQNASANNAQYGEENNIGGGAIDELYRVTVRSQQDTGAGRAMVVLQSTVKVRN